MTTSPSERERTEWPSGCAGIVSAIILLCILVIVVSLTIGAVRAWVWKS